MSCGAGDFRGEDRIKRGGISARLRLEAAGTPLDPLFALYWGYDRQP